MIEIRIPYTCKELKYILLFGLIGMFLSPFIFEPKWLLLLAFFSGFILLLWSVSQILDWHFDDKLPKFRCKCDD